MELKIAGGSIVGQYPRLKKFLRQTVPREIVALDGDALRRALSGQQSVKYIVRAWTKGSSANLLRDRTTVLRWV